MTNTTDSLPLDNQLSVKLADVVHLGDVCAFRSEIWDDFAPVSWAVAGGGSYRTHADACAVRVEFNLLGPVWPVVTVRDGYGERAMRYKTVRIDAPLWAVDAAW